MEEEEEQTTTTTTTMTMTRIFVGGLGDKVTSDDITKTFSNLGTVHSVDIIRTKSRSFAYINFLPSSPKSLAKLFSTYNGCSWKGGKLKLEKAKEHYTDRLKREWAEEAELKNSEDISQGEVDGSITDSLEAHSTIDLKDMELRVYFPKLRKVKPLPLSGTGKHKYSFRRLEAPPCPVHFCDCPEHSVLVQTRTVTRANDSGIRKGRINKKEYNMTNPVMNRFVSWEKDHRDDEIHDSIIQDCGVNDEEISMMDSVMKKLLDKATSKDNRKNVPASQKKMVLASANQEKIIKTNDVHDGTDDDDIQINASRNLEHQKSLPHDEEANDVDDETNDIDDETDDDDDDDIQINAVGARNKRRTGLANEMARLNERRNEDVESSKRKRKSVSTDANIDENNGLPKTQVKKSENHTNIPSESEPEPEPEPKRLKTNGMWSQKCAWKQLVGDGSSSSFTLSQIAPGDDINREKKPKPGKKASVDFKKGKKTVRFALETPIDIKEHEEEVNNEDNEYVHRVEPAEPKPANETPPDKRDDEEEPPVAHPARGSSWMQRCSWTQLVGGGDNSSFSISQILPDDVRQRQKSEKPNEFGASFSTVSTGSFFKEPRTTEMGSDLSKNDTQGMSAASDVDTGNMSDIEPKKTSIVPRRGVEISESCPFMRNADSVKDWMTAKTSMSNSLKKMKNK